MKPKISGIMIGKNLAINFPPPPATDANMFESSVIRASDCAVVLGPDQFSLNKRGTNTLKLWEMTYVPGGHFVAGKYVWKLITLDELYPDKNSQAAEFAFAISTEQAEILDQLMIVASKIDDINVELAGSLEEPVKAKKLLARDELQLKLDNLEEQLGVVTSATPHTPAPGASSPPPADDKTSPPADAGTKTPPPPDSNNTPSSTSAPGNIGPINAAFALNIKFIDTGAANPPPPPKSAPKAETAPALPNVVAVKAFVPALPPWIAKFTFGLIAMICIAYLGGKIIDSLPGYVNYMPAVCQNNDIPTAKCQKEKEHFIPVKMGKNSRIITGNNVVGDGSFVIFGSSSTNYVPNTVIFEEGDTQE